MPFFVAFEFYEKTKPEINQTRKRNALCYMERSVIMLRKELLYVKTNYIIKNSF